MFIKVNDNVEILSGKDKGKRGKVLKAIPKKFKIIVEGINIATKHQKARKAGEEGAIIKKELPIYVWKCQIVCPDCKQKARFGTKISDSGEKARVCKKCGAES